MRNQKQNKPGSHKARKIAIRVDLPEKKRMVLFGHCQPQEVPVCDCVWSAVLGEPLVMTEQDSLSMVIPLNKTKSKNTAHHDTS